MFCCVGHYVFGQKPGHWTAIAHTVWTKDNIQLKSEWKFHTPGLATTKNICRTLTCNSAQFQGTMFMLTLRMDAAQGR